MAASSISLDPDLLERVQRAAQREVRSPEFLLRDAVELYFRVHGEADTGAPALEQPGIVPGKHQEAGSPEVALRQVDESLGHYRQTGLHVTWDEVDEWLAALEDGGNVPPPECHT